MDNTTTCGHNERNACIKDFNNNDKYVIFVQ